MDKLSQLRRFWGLYILFIISIIGILLINQTKAEEVIYTRGDFLTLVENTENCFNCHTIYRICKPRELTSNDANFLIRFYKNTGSEIVKNYNIRVWKNVSKTGLATDYDNVQMNYTCITDSFNYTTNPNYAWCYAPNGTTIFEHDFDGGNIPSQSIWWDEQIEVGQHNTTYQEEEWDTVTKLQVKNAVINAPIGTCWDVKISGKLNWADSVDNIVEFAGFNYTEYSWWNNTWANRKNITMTNTHAQTLTDYPCNFTIDGASLISSNQLQADADDFRIIDLNGNSLNWVNTSSLNNANADIWFRCNISSSSSTDYSIYYNNSLATSNTRTNTSHVMGMMLTSDTRLLAHLDEGTGSSILDEDNGLVGTISGATWNTSDCRISNTCLHFDGVNDYAYWADNAVYDMQAMDFTLEAWVMPLLDAESDSGIGIITKRKDGSSNRNNYAMTLDEDSDIIGMNYQGGTTWVTVTNSVVTVPNTWYHIAIVYDESGNTCKYYINGTWIGPADSCTTSPTSNDANVALGILQTDNVPGSDHIHHIKLDDVRITQAALTSNQINHSAMAYIITSAFGGEESMPVNNAPTLNTTIITPTITHAGDALSCNASANDDINTSLTIEWRWFNGSNEYAFGNATSKAVDISNYLSSVGADVTDFMEVWNCSVRAYDGNSYSAYKSSKITVYEKINGTVIDSASTPINGAVVFIVHQTNMSYFVNTTTDGDGKYALTATQGGNYTVVSFDPTNSTRMGDVKPFVEVS